MKNLLLFLTALTVVLTCTLEKTMPVREIPDSGSLSLIRIDSKNRNVKTEYKMEQDSSEEKEANTQERISYITSLRPSVLP